MTRRHAQVAVSAGSAAFVTAAAVVGTANLLMPFERGWWLAAYLFLVGGLAQLLLARGQDALTAAPHAPSGAHVWAQWALWNAGTVIVALADMAQVMPAVDVGSAALLSALMLYLLGVRRGEPRPDRPASALVCGYRALVLVLAGSVLLGTFLAGALPGH